MSKNNYNTRNSIENKAIGFPLDIGAQGRHGAVEQPRSFERGQVASPILWGLGEYVTGPLFLVVSGVYTYFMPTSLSTRARFRETYRNTVKRACDVVGSIIGIVIASPLFILLPIIIKLDSPGATYYSQIRVGINRRARSRRAYGYFMTDERRRRDRRRDDCRGQLFRVFKFRTMIADAEKVSGPIWATKNDARITPIGKFLRRSRMDEVPQLLNVLKGDMSLIGPRPERPIFVRELSAQIADYDRRLSVKPGITGLAQIETGYDSSVHSVAEKIRADLRYIDNWSLWSDIKIVFRTVRVVLTGHGAN